jgi:hypothetical protein
MTIFIRFNSEADISPMPSITGAIASSTSFVAKTFPVLFFGARTVRRGVGSEVFKGVLFFMRTNVRSF